MLIKLIAAVTALIGFLASKIMSSRRDKSLGRAEQQNEELEHRLDDTHQADIIRDNLNRDPGYNERVRDRFTRP